MSNKTIWQINRHFFDVFLSIIHKIHMFKKLVVFPNWYDFTGEGSGRNGNWVHSLVSRTALQSVLIL